MVNHVYNTWLKITILFKDFPRKGNKGFQFICTSKNQFLVSLYHSTGLYLSVIFIGFIALSYMAYSHSECLVKYSLAMLSYLPCSYASCADAEGIPVFNAQEDWLDYEVVLQIERISSDLAYIGDKVDAKWAEHGFEFKCEYLNETIVYPLADIQSWNIGWVEPENEVLINPDKDPNKETDMVVVLLCFFMVALGVGAVYYSY